MLPNWQYLGPSKPQNTLQDTKFFVYENDASEAPIEEEQEQERQAQQEFASSSAFPRVFDKNYVEQLRKQFLSQQSERRAIRGGQRLGTDEQFVLKRLKEHGHPCSLSTFTCLSGHCGRSFECVQVLAFHVSYAHQDVMSATSKHLTCLLCGKKWTTVRRKIMHLSLAHRGIGEEHNSQCMLQVDSVIAPNAPKVHRLEKAQREYEHHRMNEGTMLTESYEQMVPVVEETVEEVEEIEEFGAFEQIETIDGTEYEY
ncbi:unnamed protein product [Caenorhabditis sp. 36 PRJEB53466]|nr:unnamed protein product [Caenorhabditis sp. 36 PRJEB53466]